MVRITNKYNQKTKKNKYRHNMNTKNEKILEAFKEDSRKSYKKLGEELGISDVAAKNRVTKLKEENIINRFTIEVDPHEIGYSLLATIGVQVDPQKLEEIGKELKKYDEFFSIWKVTGAHNLHMRGAFRDHNHMNSVLEEAMSKDGIREYHLSLMSEELKHDWNFSTK